jgi:hypothetical protein
MRFYAYIYIQHVYTYKGEYIKKRVKQSGWIDKFQTSPFQWKGRNRYDWMEAVISVVTYLEPLVEHSWKLPTRKKAVHYTLTIIS